MDIKRFGVLLAGAAIVVTACSSGSTPSPSAAASAEASQSAAASAPASAAGSPSPAALTYKGQITFWNTMRDFEGKEVQKLIDAWTAKNPGITVKMDLVPFDGADVKYTNAAKGQTAPDIFRSDIGWVSGFANQGYLDDLTGKVGDTSDFLAAPLGTVTYQGKIWGLPQVTDALGLQCNKKLLTQAGLSAAPTTWDDLISAGTKVTDLANKKYGFYMNADSYWVQTFTWGWGGTLFTINDQGKVASVDVNGQPSVDGWTYLKTKILGTVAPKTWDFKNSYTNMTEAFKAGTAMCIMQGPWQVADILKGTAFTDPTNLVIAPVPDGLSGKTGSPVGGHDYVVYALVKNDAAKEAAVLDLLQYIDSADSQAALAKSLGLLPTRKSAYDNAAVKADPVISAWSAVLAKATNRAGVPGAQNIYKPYTDNFQAFINDTSSDVPGAAKKYLDTVADAWKTQVFADQMAQ